MSHEPDEAEDNKAGVEAGETVGACHKHCVPENHHSSWHDQESNLHCEPEGVVVEFVVAGERDQGSPAGAQREEDLHGSICPHLKKCEKNGQKRLNTEITEVGFLSDPGIPGVRSMGPGVSQ